MQSGVCVLGGVRNLSCGDVGLLGCSQVSMSCGDVGLSCGDVGLSSEVLL